MLGCHIDSQSQQAYRCRWLYCSRGCCYCGKRVDNQLPHKMVFRHAHGRSCVQLADWACQWDGLENGAEHQIQQSYCTYDDDLELIECKGDGSRFLAVGACFASSIEDDIFQIGYYCADFLLFRCLLSKRWYSGMFSLLTTCTFVYGMQIGPSLGFKASL